MDTTKEMTQVNSKKKWLLSRTSSQISRGPKESSECDSSFSNLHRESNASLESKVIGAVYPHGHLLVNASDCSSKRSLSNSKKSAKDPSYKNNERFSKFLTDTEKDWECEIENGIKGINKMTISNNLSPLPRLDPKSFNLKPAKEMNEIAEDPLRLLDLNSNIASECTDERSSSRSNRFAKLLRAKNIDLSALRKLAWNGIPSALRPIVWQVLLGYLPTSLERRKATLSKKRNEYLTFATKLLSRGPESLNPDIWHQIHIDVPRTNPNIPLYQNVATQRCLERILYSWAIRHPASGYVQGINDLVTPFFEVFLSAFTNSDVEELDPSFLPRNILDIVEADSFWCLSKLLVNIQENYIFAQPGIHRQVLNLKELINRIDLPLANHLVSEGVEFMQFSFRWMNCLLMRELQIKHIIRMWDTYLSEGPAGFSEYHLYVCAAFLLTWSEKLLEMDFQDILIFLQSLPTAEWNEKQVELLLSEAFLWKSLFSGSAAHLKVSSTQTS